jgi:hypothetical protein
MDEQLNQLPLGVLVAGFFVGLVVSREFGSWLGRKVFLSIEGDASDQGHIVSGALGLLALLVAFTFSLSLDRFEARRHLVVEEANAIGTAEMRVRLLEPPYAMRLSDLYVRYARLRLSYGEAKAADKAPLESASQALRSQIQTEALTALQPIRATPLAASVIAAVNESLDVGVAREAAHEARLPGTVLVVLAIYAFVSSGVLGYVLGGGASHDRALCILLFVLLTLAAGMILDLDRSRSGTITISQTPLERLVAGFAATPPPAPGSPPSPATAASPAAGGSSRP